MEEIAIRPVTDGEIDALAAMADEIWHECFQELLSPAQIDYMVGLFQSAPAMRAQVAAGGYQYYFLLLGGERAGYMAIQPQPAADSLFLSKVYLKKAFRGKKITSAAFRFLEAYCREHSLHRIWLTVNKHNRQAIEVYRHQGFSVFDTQVADIGEGFVMDDYLFEKKISG